MIQRNLIMYRHLHASSNISRQQFLDDRFHNPWKLNIVSLVHSTTAFNLSHLSSLSQPVDVLEFSDRVTEKMVIFCQS